jgi:cytochrome c peroxidase
VPRPATPLELALRPETTRRAAAIPKAFARLEHAGKRKDRAAAWSAYLELRGAWRALLPIGELLTYSSQLEPDDEPDEVPTDLGLRALGEALQAKPPDFARLGRALDLTRPATRLAESEARVMVLAPAGVANAASRGVFAWGAMLDGSRAESREEARIDALQGGRALSDHAARVLGLGGGTGHPEQRLRRARAAFDGWLDALEKAAPDTPIRDKLSGLLLSAELGGALRGFWAARGAVVPPPFLPRRRARPSEPEEPVSVATFPRLPGPEPRADRAALGRALFFDTRLSENGRASCATCHVARHALSAGPTRPRGVDGRPVTRDVPGLWNVAFDPMFFWDARASTLERQVTLAVERDLSGHWPDIVDRLSRDAELSANAKAAFPEGVTERSVREALSELERTLVSDETPFDRRVRGDTEALSAEALRGFDLYFGEARCSRCHRLPLTSGTEPPRFTRGEVGALGVPTAPGKKELDPDRGRGGVTQRPEHAHAFKVPTLRNLALTAPYFHHGGFRTLEEVVDFYEKGAGKGLDIAPPSFDMDARAFELSPAERKALLVFLRESLLDRRATAAP